MDNQLQKYNADVMKSLSKLQAKMTIFDPKRVSVVTRTDLDNLKSEIVAQLTETIEKLESKVSDLEQSNYEMRHRIDSMEQKFENILSEIAEVGYTAEKASFDINELEQYTRKSSIRVFGGENEGIEKPVKKFKT